VEVYRETKEPGFPYMVSNLGNIKREASDRKRHSSAKVLSFNKTKSNEEYLGISLLGKRYSAHRLVAEAFIPNPDNLPVAHHKDEDATNNKEDNLEWVTHSRNSEASLGKRVAQLTKEGELIKEWPSVASASESLGLNKGNVARVARNEDTPGGKSAGGFKWEYK